MKKTSMMMLFMMIPVAASILSGCSGVVVAKESDNVIVDAGSVEYFDNSEDGGYAIEVDGETREYRNGRVTKTGDSEGDEADFYGENAAVFATNGAQLTLSEMDITSDGTHANAVFSYGKGTVVDISDSTISTTGNCSGGLMTTGGGTMNASDLRIHTTGNSSAAIRSDRGGGVVTVTGGEYETEGKGSPAVYSTADITVNDAVLRSGSSEGVVVEGKNSVALNNVTLYADHNQHNSNKSDHFNAVMIYQSMSGDADEGLSGFSATGGSITNANGDIFFVNNTATDITLDGVEITNNGDGVFLRAEAAGWGNEGSNGGKVNLTAFGQQIDGDMIVDEVSVLNLHMKDGSIFSGAVNPDGSAGEVYVELTDGAKWVLTNDSYISALTCDADSIDLNGHNLYVDGKAYEKGASSGTAIEIEVNEGNGSKGDMPAPPDGEKKKPEDGGKTPPNGEKKKPEDGGKTPPNGEMKKPEDGGKTPPNGDMKKPEDGGKTPPDGEMKKPEDRGKTPTDGEMKKPEGGGKTPSNGEKKKPGDGIEKKQKDDTKT